MPNDNPWLEAPTDPSNPWAESSQFTTSEQDSGPVLPGQISRLDFWDAIKQNRRNTWFLILSMLALAGAFGYVLGWAWDLAFGGQLQMGMQYLGTGAIDWRAVILTPSPTGIKLGLSLLAAMVVWSAFSLLRADKAVLSMANAQETAPEQLPQLHNVIEEVAIAAGLPKPKIYLVQTDMPNAFATGLHSDKAMVGITTGLLQRLNRRELQNVMAHEMGHVLNGDMRYATIMAVMTGMLVFVAQMVLQSRGFLYYGGNRRDRNGNSGNPLLFIIMIVVFIMTAILVPLIARIIQMAISRQREYLADATAVRLTRDPEGMIAALQKIAESEAPVSPMNHALEPLLFMAPEQMLHNGNMGWFSTHPSVESRIQRLKMLE